MNNEQKTIKVLDHGYVKFIASMGSDEQIIEAARMSTGKGFISWEPYRRCADCGAAWLLVDHYRLEATPSGSDCIAKGQHNLSTLPRGDLGLLETLWASGHTTPFEIGGELHLEVQLPLFVAREWHKRHRCAAYSEFSARYAQMPNLHYLPELGRVQKQSKSMKQGSGEPLEAEVAQAWVKMMGAEQELIYSAYAASIKDHGIANELARINTPVSRYTKMRAKTDLWNWLNFLRLRLTPNAQYEIRVYAEAVAGLIKEIWPKTYALFEEHTLGAVKLSHAERVQLAAILKAYLGNENSAHLVVAEKLLGKVMVP